ncbi:MAG: arsenate reductase ArsC [Thermoanaerobaculia bacterium]
MPLKLRILYLCTGNSCRSQMAEAWTRHLHGDAIATWSAGTVPKPVDPRAIEAMREVGVSISEQHSKGLEGLLDLDLDYVVTVCDGAHESCPVFPGRARIVHRGFEDPPALAEEASSEEEALSHYRRIRDEIRRFVETLPEGLLQQEGID